MSIKWDGNARVYEDNRLNCEEEAARAERDGNNHRARWWRDLAETWRRRRDGERAEMERRRIGRSAAARANAAWRWRVTDQELFFGGQDPLDELFESEDRRDS